MREVLAADQWKHAAQVKLVEIIATFTRHVVPLELGWLEQGAQACLDTLQAYGDRLQDLLWDLAFHPQYV